MLLIAMPISVVVLATVGLSRGVTTGVSDALSGAIVLVYMWGAVTAALASVMHTAVTNLRPSSRIFSIAVGLIFGLIAGALTPTPFTGLVTPAAILLGGLTGLVYAVLVEALPFTTRSRAPA
jgi:predicted membrane channel-forming protein YqfA (hemolysin III family)